jgi:hypothetical protein
MVGRPPDAPGDDVTGVSLSVFTIDQEVTLTEVLMILLGIAITWAVYYGSERAELPGEATIPDPGLPDDMVSDTRGRSLQ